MQYSSPANFVCSPHSPVTPAGAIAGVAVAGFATGEPGAAVAGSELAEGAVVGIPPCMGDCAGLLPPPPNAIAVEAGVGPCAIRASSPSRPSVEPAHAVVNAQATSPMRPIDRIIPTT